MDRVGASISFTQASTRAQEVAFESLQKVKGINDTVLKDLANLLPQAIENGAGIDQLEDIVRQVFGHARNRARTIAQTTATPVFEVGQVDAFGDAGFEERSWLSRRDGKVREGTFDHVEPDGQVVKLDEAFLVSGESLDFPGDPTGSAGNIINCRCTQQPIFP
jgi:uncharacterized protein with gpF-like domain